MLSWLLFTTLQIETGMHHILSSVLCMLFILNGEKLQASATDNANLASPLPVGTI